jgi:hypothetical protein
LGALREHLSRGCQRCFDDAYDRSLGGVILDS